MYLFLIFVQRCNRTNNFWKDFHSILNSDSRDHPTGLWGKLNGSTIHKTTNFEKRLDYKWLFVGKTLFELFDLESVMLCQNYLLSLLWNQ